MFYEKLSSVFIHRWRSHPKTWIGVGMLVALLIMGCQLSPSQSNSPTAKQSSATNKGDVILQANVQSLPIGATVQVSESILELEVATTPQQRATGLMNRTALADNRGMVFTFSPARKIGFWMKNTLIPLDMIFLRNHQIVNIHHNVQPCKTIVCPSYPSKTSTDEVIELRAGRAAELNLSIGDPLVVEYLP